MPDAEPPVPPRWLARQVARPVASVVEGGLLAAVLLPGLGLVGAPVHAGPVTVATAIALTAAVGLLAWRFALKAPPVALTALVTLAVGSILLRWASYPGSGLVVAFVMGLGLGPLVQWQGRQGPWATVWPIGAGAVLLITARQAAGVDWAAGLMVAAATVAAAGRFRGVAPKKEPGRLAVFVAAEAVAVLFAAAWVGSTSPSVWWFGALTSHGPRQGNEVALTFDDGPNPPWTLEISALLENYGVRGTFFEVGKAVTERPDVTHQLVVAGHVVGNHSYRHDAVGYLNPWYPELDRAERAIRDQAGGCPALFRPPHGTHTPFMSRVVSNRGMKLVTWDVSAKDWLEDDPERLARNILANVRPGSIVLLHDGSDGNIPADRSVVVRALPAIIEGLRARGLEPVTLDRLLNVPAYLPPDRC